VKALLDGESFADQHGSTWIAAVEWMRNDDDGIQTIQYEFVNESDRSDSRRVVLRVSEADLDAGNDGYLEALRRHIRGWLASEDVAGEIDATGPRAVPATS